MTAEQTQTLYRLEMRVRGDALPPLKALMDAVQRLHWDLWAERGSFELTLTERGEGRTPDRTIHATDWTNP